MESHDILFSFYVLYSSQTQRASIEGRAGSHDENYETSSQVCPVISTVVLSLKAIYVNVYRLGKVST